MKRIILLFICIALISTYVVGEGAVGYTYSKTEIDSILALSNITEAHQHHQEFVLSKYHTQTSTNKADTSASKFYTFDLTAAADSTLGTAVQILGTDDTPFIAGHTTFDFDKGKVIAVNSNVVYIVRISWGASAAAGQAVGNYTDTWVHGDASNPQLSNPTTFDISMPRLPVDTLVWAQISNPAGGQTMSFLFEAHEYD